MANNLGLYSIDLSLWEKSPYLSSQGKTLQQITRSDWENMIKGMYDWIRALQKPTGVRAVKDTKLNQLMYAYGKRRPLKFVLVTVISKSHKSRLKQHLSDTVYHAHVLVYGYKTTVVCKLIKYYWSCVKMYSGQKIRTMKCYDDGKLTYNLAQTDGVKPKICISPVITGDDLKALYYGEFASIDKFNKTNRVKTKGIIETIRLYGKNLISNGYSTSVKGRWLAGIKSRKHA